MDPRLREDDDPARDLAFSRLSVCAISFTAQDRLTKVLATSPNRREFVLALAILSPPLLAAFEVCRDRHYYARRI
jgi:hypothetical protein